MPQVLRPDANTDNADWTKYAWDFPPYKSPEFFEAIGDDPQQLDDGHVDKMQYREGFESNGMGGWHDANMSKALPSASFLATDEQEAIEALHQRRMHPGLK
jgi:hypothetical protein